MYTMVGENFIHDLECIFHVNVTLRKFVRSVKCVLIMYE